jgi:rubrerythrin/uncharacterized membrane protein
MAGPKKWKCTVCGYIHEGDEPPDECPVCKQPKNVFVPFEEEDDEAPAEDAAEPSEETAKPAADDRSETPPAEATAPSDESEPRRWRCTVCNYIHTGDSPPDTCPVCKQAWTKFVPHVEGEDGATTGAKKPEAAPNEPTEVAAAKPPVDGADRWRCTVCNYVHSGSEPPDLCPVCGAGSDAFTPETKSPEHHHEGIGGLVEKLHLHPVTAHFPNGSLPLALVAWIAYLVLGEPSLERTSFYLMAVAMAAAPVTFFSGWSDAGHRFGTTTTGVFPEKKLWGWVLMGLGIAMVGWRLSIGWAEPPDTTMEIALYSGFLVVGSGVVSRLGMLGGKLVFGH